MRKLLAAALLVFVGVIAWRIGSALSSDALGMAVGIVFGCMAGLPAAVLVVVGLRAHEDRRDAQQMASERGRQPASPYAFQPPVIVVTGAGQAGANPGWPAQQAFNPAANAYGPPQGNGWEQLPANRQFKVVGEQEEWLQD